MACLLSFKHSLPLKVLVLAVLSGWNILWRSTYLLLLYVQVAAQLLSNQTPSLTTLHKKTSSHIYPTLTILCFLPYVITTYHVYFLSYTIWKIHEDVFLIVSLAIRTVYGYMNSIIIKGSVCAN